MSEIAIRVESVGKKYRLAHKGAELSRPTFREELLRSSKLIREFFSPTQREQDEFWALQEVSFEVKVGEILGIIGRNGAGKSTLLKILSRIIAPTTGVVDMYGRVGSLLEVGTGFHPELTGRENIYLSGAILGLGRNDVKKRFDEIVAFAGIEKFLDTPSKHYSSGMYTRLGFAVAAHLDAGILLVDEVLAVGDAEFQKKCLGKMSEVAGDGRTIIFVSHNLAATQRLCTQALLMDTGRAMTIGPVDQVIQQYITSVSRSGEMETGFPSNSGIKLEEFHIESADGSRHDQFFTSEVIAVSIDVALTNKLPGLRVGFDLSLAGNEEVIFRSFDDDLAEIDRSPGRYQLRALIPANLIKAGEYRLSLAVGIHNESWICNGDVFRTFTVMNIKGVNSRYSDQRPGVIAPAISWEVK